MQKNKQKKNTPLDCDPTVIKMSIDSHKKRSGKEEEYKTAIYKMYIKICHTLCLLDVIANLIIFCLYNSIYLYVDLPEVLLMCQ